MESGELHVLSRLHNMQNYSKAAAAPLAAAAAALSAA